MRHRVEVEGTEEEETDLEARASKIRLCDATGGRGSWPMRSSRNVILNRRPMGECRDPAQFFTIPFFLKNL